RVDRMIVLSDGRANHGVRDLVGLARIAEEAREAEVAITTVGLGFDYNEKTLAQLASASNGSHHFVPDASALDTVFAAEAAAASASVAAECMAHVKLAEGVELLEVVDRAHRQTDGGVAVPLGAFSPGERKTVLLRVRLPAGGEGNEGVASLELRYRDLGMDGEGMVAGALAVSIVSDTDGALDPLVDLRLQRRRTAAALKEASRLFEGGRLEAARRVLEDNARDIDRARHSFEPGMPRERDPRRTDILGDLATQSRDTQASLDNLRQAEQLRGQRRRGFVLDNQMMMNPYFD
ncbi:MAG: VWA domain-containing protein, partial [Myxococcales bacterium]|nr:VWA domain-containing protein [Myxococcales bacterium]